ncbi:transposase [Streptomyces griseofuscus]
MAGLVERLVAQKLWELFRRMVPPTEMVRQQGGGKKRVADDREVLAGIVFVATSGCTSRQLPPVPMPIRGDGRESGTSPLAPLAKAPNRRSASAVITGS